MSRPASVLASRVVLVVAALALLAGCWEQRQRVVVNPDGSARIQVERSISARAARQMGMGGQADLEEAARDQAAEIVEGVRGVEAWTDVTWSASGDSLRFSGTAYVPDLSEYAFEDPGGEHDRTITSLDVRREEGALTVELAPSGDEEEDEDPLGDLTEQQSMEQARQLQSETRRMRAMAATFFAGMEETVVLELPTEPTGVEGFERRDDGAWGVTFRGDSLLAAMGGVVEMETSELAARLREAASAGQTRDQAMGALMERRFGSVPARFEIPAGGEPQFDYEAEVAEAREAWQEIRDRLGIGDDAGADDGPANGGGGDAAVAKDAGDTGAGAGGEAMGAEAAPAPAEGGGAAAAGEAGPADAGEEMPQGPPRPVRLSVGHPDLAGSLELGTTVVITLPGAAGVRRLGLATDGPRGLTITDETGRDLVAASREAHAAWEEAHPNTFTSRGVATWSLTTVGDDPEVPAVEIELWATPSADARSLAVRGAVPIRTPPESTTTTEVPTGRVEDGAELELGGRTATLSRYGTVTRGDERSKIYEVEGDAIVTAVRRGGETLWEMDERGAGRIEIPEELSGGEPLVFEHGAAGVRRVEVDLEFGLGLGSGGTSGDR